MKFIHKITFISSIKLISYEKKYPEDPHDWWKAEWDENHPLYIALKELDLLEE